MPEIKPEQLILVAAFVLPGAVSMYVYGYLIPQKELKLQERIAEAVCFSLLNVILVGIPFKHFTSVKAVSVTELEILGWAAWPLLVAALIVLPALWPFLLVWLLRFAEKNRWIQIQAKTAWDDVFGRQRAGCWLQVEMNDGKFIGGRFDRRSYASSYPDPGHLHIEELWRVDEQGFFCGAPAR